MLSVANLLIKRENKTGLHISPAWEEHMNDSVKSFPVWTLLWKGGGGGGGERESE